MKIVIDNYGDHINGSIKDGVIRLNAEKFTGKTKSQVLAKILAHEITHRMQETAPEAYAKYRDAALQNEADLLGRGLDDVIRGYQQLQVAARERAVADARANNPDITPEQIEAIEADYPDLSREDAMDEIAADYTQKFVEDTEAFREFIGKSKEHRSLGRKLIDCAKAIVAKIKANFSGQKARDAASQEAFGKDLAAAEKALKLWEEAYAEGQKAIKNAPVRESTGEGLSRNSTADISDILGIQRIGRKSVNEFNSEEIGRLEKFARKYWKNMGVTSPFFRAWFGDWRAYDITRIRYVPVNTDFVKMEDIPRGSFHNNDTGWDISSTRDGINETTHKKGVGSAEHRALSDLDSMLRKAVLLDTVVASEPSKRMGKSTVLVHHLYCPIIRDGNKAVAKLYVTEDIQGGHRFYLTKIEEVTHAIVAAANNGSIDPRAKRTAGDTSSEMSVAEIFAFVKEHDADYEADSEKPVYFNPKPVNPVLLNEDGTPKVMYRGDSENFTVFDRKKSKYSNLFGKGFYFTDSNAHAGQYGNVRSFYLSVQNPVSTQKTTITKEQMRKFLEAVAENEDYGLENYGYGATVDSVLQSVYGKSDFAMIYDVNSTAIGDMVAAVELFNEVNGTNYDGFILNTETVVFDPTQIKSATDNIGTFDRSNPDIRYSLSGDDILAEAEERAAAKRATQDRLNYLRKQVAATKQKTADPKSVDKIAGRLVRQWGADMEAGDISQDLQVLYDHILRESEVDLWEEATSIGRKIAENITQVEGDIFAEYREMRKELRDMHIYVSPEVVADIPDYFDTVRPYRNRLKLTTKQSSGAMGIDQAFQVLSNAYPEFFSEDNVSVPSDQLQRLLEVTDTICAPGSWLCAFQGHK